MAIPAFIMGQSSGSDVEAPEPSVPTRGQKQAQNSGNQKPNNQAAVRRRKQEMEKLQGGSTLLSQQASSRRSNSRLLNRR